MGHTDDKTKQAVDMANQFAEVAFDHLAKLGVDQKNLAPDKLKKMYPKKVNPKKYLAQRELSLCVG